MKRSTTKEPEKLPENLNEEAPYRNAIQLARNTEERMKSTNYFFKEEFAARTGDKSTHDHQLGPQSRKTV